MNFPNSLLREMDSLPICTGERWTVVDGRWVEVPQKLESGAPNPAYALAPYETTYQPPEGVTWTEMREAQDAMEPINDFA